MSACADVVIVGAGLAGVHCALALRRYGFDGPVRLFGEETRVPYDRPPLSKGVLLRHAEVGAPPLVEPQVLVDAGIDWLRGRSVAAIDIAAQRVVDRDGQAHPWRHLVLATGARARRLSLPGLDGDDERVQTLRDADDALRLREACSVRGRQLVVIGGGYIGLEVAASAATLGLQVSVLEAQPRLLARSATPLASRAVAALHARHGVHCRTAVCIERIDATPAKLSVTCSDEVLDAELLFIGAGSEARSELASAAGLEVDNGIVCDRRGRTSHDAIHACGDVARWCTPGTRDAPRMESWASAREQGEIVAASIADQPIPAPAVPWFWTDQFDANLQMLGTPAPADAWLVHGQPDGKRWSEFALRDGRLVGATLFNTGALRRAVERAIAAGRVLNRHEFAALDLDVKAWLAAGANSETHAA